MTLLLLLLLDLMQILIPSAKVNGLTLNVKLPNVN